MCQGEGDVVTHAKHSLAVMQRTSWILDICHPFNTTLKLSAFGWLRYEKSTVIDWVMCQWCVMCVLKILPVLNQLMKMYLTTHVRHCLLSILIYILYTLTYSISSYAADFWLNHLDVFHGINNAWYAHIFCYVEWDDHFSFYAQVQLRQQVLSLALEVSSFWRLLSKN